MTEDPNDFIATHILRGATGLSDHVVLFAALYLLAHGIVKVVLVTAPTVGLVALAMFDALIVFLTWHEYQRHRRRAKT